MPVKSKRDRAFGNQERYMPNNIGRDLMKAGSAEALADRAGDGQRHILRNTPRASPRGAGKK
jgi:hypothetical protein